MGAVLGSSSNGGLADSILGEGRHRMEGGGEAGRDKEMGEMMEEMEEKNGGRKDSKHGRVGSFELVGLGREEEEGEEREEDEEEQGFLKLVLLGLCHAFSAALVVCKAWYDFDGGRGGAALNTFLMLNGIAQLVNTPLKLTFLATNPKNSQSIREHTRAWFTGGIFYLWIGGVIDLVVTFINILNPKDRLISPIFCAINSSGLGFIVLLSLIGSLAFLVEFVYYSFLALSCGRLWLVLQLAYRSPIRVLCKSHCYTSFIAGLLVLATGVAMLSSYILFFENNQDETLLRFRIVRLLYQVGTFVILWFGLIKTSDRKQDRTFEIHIRSYTIKSYTHQGIVTFLFVISASVGGLLLAIDVMFSTLNQRSASWILLVPPLVAFFALLYLFIYYATRMRHDKPGFETERVANRLNVFFCSSRHPKRNIFYTFLLAASVTAHAVGAKNQMNYDDTFKKKPYMQIMWSNILEIMISVLIYAIVVLRPTRREQFNPLAAVIFQILVIVNWVGALIEDVSHMHETFESCDNHGDKNDESQLVYVELTLLAFYTEFCLFSWQIFGESILSPSDPREQNFISRPASEMNGQGSGQKDFGFHANFHRKAQESQKYVHSVGVVRNTVNNSGSFDASFRLDEVRDGQSRMSALTPRFPTSSLMISRAPTDQATEIRSRVESKATENKPQM